MKEIIIFKEKYGNRCFDASTKELRNKAALKILTERFEAGCWYYEPCKPEPYSAECLLTQEQIDNLPTPGLQDSATRAVKAYKRCLKQYEQDLQEFNDIDACVNEQNATWAWELISSRSNYEYEEFKIELIETVE